MQGKAARNDEAFGNFGGLFGLLVGRNGGNGRLSHELAPEVGFGCCDEGVRCPETERGEEKNDWVAVEVETPLF